MTSQFETWFLKQFGPPPERPILARPKSSDAAVFLGEMHDEFIEKERTYCDRKEVTQSAWNAAIEERDAETCEWILNEYGERETSCGHIIDSDFDCYDEVKHCNWCGKRIKLEGEVKEKSKVTSRQEEVLEYLRGKDWTSPTVISGAVWGGRHHSASASPVCLRLVKKGLLKRNNRGHYRTVTTESKTK